MSAFREMNVTVQRGDEFRTVTLDETHDASVVERLGESAERAGYEVVSVVVSTHMFDAEMWPHLSSVTGIANLLEALSDDEYAADFILAYTTVADEDEITSWSDTVYFSGTAEEICNSWAEAFHRRYEEKSGRYAFSSEFQAAEPWPAWLEVDWDASLEQLARDESANVVEFEGVLYYFG